MQHNAKYTCGLSPPLINRYTDGRDVAFRRFMDVISVSGISPDRALERIYSRFPSFHHWISMSFLFICLSLNVSFTIALLSAFLFFVWDKVLKRYSFVVCRFRCRRRVGSPVILTSGVQLFPCSSPDLFCLRGQEYEFFKAYTCVRMLCSSLHCGQGVYKFPFSYISLHLIWKMQQ